MSEPSEWKPNFVFDERQCRQLYVIIRTKLEYIIACSKLPHDNGIDAIDEAIGILDDLQAIGLIDTSATTGKYMDPQPRSKVGDGE